MAKTTGSEIRNQNFRKVFRGLDAAEVKSFLDRIASDWDAAAAALASLEQRAQDLESQVREFRELEKGLQQTITQVQEAGGKAVESAKGEARLIIRESELKAAHIVEKARNDLTLLKEQVMILKAKRDAIASRLGMLLRSELDLIRALGADDGPPQSPAATATPGTEETTDISREKREIEEILRSLDR